MFLSVFVGVTARMHGYLVRISHYLWFPLGGWAFVFLGFCMGEWLCLVGGGGYLVHDLSYLRFGVYIYIFDEYPHNPLSS